MLATALHVLRMKWMINAFVFESPARPFCNRSRRKKMLDLSEDKAVKHWCALNSEPLRTIE